MFSIRDGVCAGLPSVELMDGVSDTRAVIIPGRGALTTSFYARGREFLAMDEATLPDTKQNVRGGIPVLFPSPGRLVNDTFEALGMSGRLKQHGFARAQPWKETARGVDGSAWVTLELRDSAETRAQFPFAFRVELTFSLVNTRLRLFAVVENVGERALPFALGYHPYFAVPEADKASSRIPTSATRAWDNVAKQDITLSEIKLDAGEVDLHLIDHKRSDATLESPIGRIELAGDFTRWVVWTLPGKDFVCLEPWTAAADALNTGEGRTDLAPGESRSFELALTVYRGLNV